MGDSLQLKFPSRGTLIGILDNAVAAKDNYSWLNKVFPVDNLRV